MERRAAGPPGTQDVAPGVGTSAVEDRYRLAGVLGLGPRLRRSVATWGARALVEYAEVQDRSGDLTRLLAISQALGTYLEDRFSAGQPPDDDDVLEAVADFAGSFGVQPALAAELMGTVLEVYRQAARIISEETTENVIRDVVGPGTGEDEGLRVEPAGHGANQGAQPGQLGELGG